MVLNQKIRFQILSSIQNCIWSYSAKQKFFTITTVVSTFYTERKNCEQKKDTVFNRGFKVRYKKEKQS